MHHFFISTLSLVHWILRLRLQLANASRPNGLKSSHWLGEIWYIILRLSYPLRIIFFFFSVQSSLRTLSSLVRKVKSKSLAAHRSSQDASPSSEMATDSGCELSPGSNYSCQVEELKTVRVQSNELNSIPYSPSN